MIRIRTCRRVRDWLGSERIELPEGIEFIVDHVSKTEEGLLAFYSSPTEEKGLCIAQEEVGEAFVTDDEPAQPLLEEHGLTTSPWNNKGG